METTDLLNQLSTNIWLQGLIVAAGSCFIEDPFRCGVACVYANGTIGWKTALISMIIGGMAGDFGLYLIGRYASILLYKRRWISYSKVTWMKSYFKNHAVSTLFAARFLPGGRLPTYTVAGIIRFKIPRLLIILAVAATIQALLFLWLGDIIKETILPYITSPWMKYGVLALTLGTFFISYKLFGKQQKKRSDRLEASRIKEEETEK